MYLLDIGDIPGTTLVEFTPPLTANQMERLGIDKLLGFLSITREELGELMVSESCELLEDLALLLSETMMVCPHCSNEYADIDIGICAVCSDNIKARW